MLAAIACDEDVSFNEQLIHPFVNAAGRRAVQRYLISVIETGTAHQKVCADLLAKEDDGTNMAQIGSIDQ